MIYILSHSRRVGDTRHLQVNLKLCSTMAASTASLLLLSLLSLAPPQSLSAASPYLSPATLFKNYGRMLASFKIFIYAPQKPFNFTATPSSLFHAALLHSPFLTENADEAHLFFIPFPPDISTRTLARLVRELRWNFPFWNRTLGADHFFVHPVGIDFSADRNILELKKNSVQISIFPTVSGRFIPHKDVTMLPHAPPSISHALENETAEFLGYLKWDGETEKELVEDLESDGEFVIESQPPDHLGRVKSSKFCVFLYNGGVSWLPEAMAHGCVPAVIVDRPIQDLPLMDVLRWGEMAVLAGPAAGASGLKRLLRGVTEGDYERMRRSCASAAHHLLWNAEAQPYDAFYMLIYQLWLRRHTVRYARSEPPRTG